VRLIFLLSLALACPSSLLPALHPNSVSSSRLTVDGRRVRLELRCQAATLIEASALDRDGDGKLGADELAAGLPALGEYVLGGYRLSREVQAGAWNPIDGKLVDGRIVEGGELVDFVFEFEAATKIDALRIDFSLFRESNPLHRDQAQVSWNGSAPRSRLLWIEEPTWIVRPGSGDGGSFLAFVGMGFQHILSGYDHIAFLVALVVSARRLRSLLGVVTAFTLAHSVTLALAALDVVRLPAGPVEAAIALSIAWVGLRTAIQPKARRLWPEAFGFGLVHGLGFARILADSLAAEPDKLRGLVGFNLGIEAGQIAIVIATATVFALVRLAWPSDWRTPTADRAAAAEHATAADRSAKTERRDVTSDRSTDEDRTDVGSPAFEGLAPRGLRRPISAAVGALGLYWLLARTFAG
jgi:hydrogenase/urease accessory protein HupE